MHLPRYSLLRAFARLRSLLQIMPGYQADNAKGNMAARVISREPKDPQFVSRFPPTLSRSLSQDRNCRRYLKIQWNFFKVFNRCLRFNLQGIVQRSFGKCLGLQLSASLWTSTSHSVHWCADRYCHEQLPLMDQQTRTSTWPNAALHLQLPS